MKKKLILAVLIVAAAAVAGILVFRKGEPDDRIRFSGNIELTEVQIGFKTSGRLAERRVDEGDSVKAGEVIARLDDDTLQKQKEREQAGLEAATALLAQARTAVDWQRETVDSEIGARRADLDQTVARLNELEAGSRPQEIDQARAAVAAAEAEQQRAAQDWDRAQVLFKQDDISRAQFDQFRARNETAAAALREARERSALVKEGPRKEQIEAARAMVSRAKAALRQAEAQKFELKRREQEIPTRQAEIGRARAQLQYVEAQIDDTTVSSPVGGVVLVKAADVGEILAPGTTVVTIGDLDHPWLRGYINETDLGRVKLGDKVRITTDSYPGKTYQGRISFIASEAEFTPKQIQTPEERVKLVYRIKVDVDNQHRELKLNMPVDAEIVLGDR